MANAMVALATTTLGSAASSVTFGSIPATYRDLRIVANTLHTSATSPLNQIYIQLNGDTGSNYSRVTMRGDGSSATSDTSSGTEINIILDAPAGAGYYAVTKIDLMDYSATDKHKSLLIRSDAASVNTVATAGRWASTAAVTSVLLKAPTDTWVAGSSFSLYGIVSA